MLKKIGFTLISTLFAIISFNTSAYAMVTNVLQPGMTIEYELAPGEPQVFVNYLFWDIEANCRIAAIDLNNELLAEAKQKKGKVNDIELLAGQSLRICVHPGENVKINADSGAKVIITNFGEHLLKATCTA